MIKEHKYKNEQMQEYLHRTLLFLMLGIVILTAIAFMIK